MPPLSYMVLSISMNGCVLRTRFSFAPKKSAMALPISCIENMFVDVEFFVAW